MTRAVLSSSIGALTAAVIGSSLLIVPFAPAAQAGPIPIESKSFGFTGRFEMFTVPDGVSSLSVTVTGAAGGQSISRTGGRAATVEADIPVGPNEVIDAGDALTIRVGGLGLPYGLAGWNGGGAGGDGGSAGSGGGGASDILMPFMGGDAPMVVAGGGGGAGYANSGTRGAGGDAGSDGQDGQDFPNGGGAAGEAGTMTGGGSGGVGGANSQDGKPGVFNQGGAGGDGANLQSDNGGGGGGGGYYAGGGGGGATYGHGGGGGGGGSSFAIGPATNVTTATATTAAQVVITWVAASPIELNKPTIQGTAQVDETLTAIPDVITPGTTLEYVWKADGDVVGGNQATYVPTADDVDKTITVTTKATLHGYAETESTSEPTAAVALGTLEGHGGLAMRGTPRVGETLTAYGSFYTVPQSTMTGQWYRGSTPIEGANSTTYVLTADDLGQRPKYVLTGSLPGYADRSTSVTYEAIAPGVITLPTPVVSGTAKVGRTLTVDAGDVKPSDATVTFRWLRGATLVGTEAEYTPTPADLGATLTVEATASAPGYLGKGMVSDETAAIGKGTLSSTGGVTVTGTTKVGSTLTAVSDLATTPAAQQVTRQWLRGETPIPGATGTSYVLTDDDALEHIGYSETHAVDGYEDVVETSTPTAAITGVITLVKPVIHGEGHVDQLLTAESGTVSPADATIDFTWTVGGVDTSGPTYTVKPADVGKTLTLTARATKQGYETASASRTTGDLQQAHFATAPTPVITGVFRVGEKLTVDEGAVAPTPDSYRYRWTADGDPIEGATSRTLTLERAQKNARIGVEVTAVRAGYADSSGSSDTSAPVTTDLAPGLSLTQSTTALRRGQSVVLGWTSLDALSLQASGDWSGARSAIGLETVTPPRSGTAVYTLTATNDRGTTTAQVAVEVTPPAKKLWVVARREVRQGRWITVKTRGLERGEEYTIRLGGKVVATGRADKLGRVHDRVRVTSSVATGTRAFRVTGSTPDRTGTRKVVVVRPR